MSRVPSCEPSSTMMISLLTTISTMPSGATGEPMMTVADAHPDLHRMHAFDDLPNRGYLVVARDED